MADWPAFDITDQWVLSHRGSKNPVDPFTPYAIHHEPELSANGKVEETGTIFLTNRECPFRCLMCDLWKNTTDQPVPSGAIPAQISRALQQLPDIRHVKLYNSGNFFDKKAIPPEDYRTIAALLNGYDSVIIENHPALVGEDNLAFRDMLEPPLEMAMGLETVHPEVLKKLNKKMTLRDFEKAAGFLHRHNIRTRAFILLRPPFMTEEEGVEWAMRSIDFAFDCGVSTCVVIPTRPGNGATDQLARDGFFDQPGLQALEEVIGYGIARERGRVFTDIWDLESFSRCEACLPARKSRLHRMNLSQRVFAAVDCHCTT